MIKLRLIFRIIMGLWPMMVFSQSTDWKYTDTIPRSFLSGGLEDVYAEKIRICGNPDFPNLVSLVYLTEGSDSFRIQLYRLNDSLAPRIAEFSIKNSIEEEMLNRGFNFTIKNINFIGNKLYVHYYRYITVVSVNGLFNAVELVETINIKSSLNHTYKYILPLNDGSDNFIGVLKRYYDSFPELPETALCPRILELMDNSIKVTEEYTCSDIFEDYYWPFFGFDPIQITSKGLYAINALSHNLSFFDKSLGTWQEIPVIGTKHLDNNMVCVEFLKLTTNNNRHALYNGCYPRNFYYKFLFADSSSIYLLRNYADSGTTRYYIDEFKFDSLHRANYSESIELSSMKTNYPGNKEKWTSTDLLLSPLFVNEDFFCRLIQVKDDKQKNLLLFEVYSRIEVD